jgi:HD-GYP domain-containing protein (c-di-GMP phosphodiesterase class II)
VFIMAAAADTSTLRLLRLVQSQVQVGKPLPFGVRDEQGKLLLARGHVILDQGQLDALLDRGAFVDAEELRRARGGAVEEVAARALTLFECWEQMIWRLDRLLNSIAEPGFVQRCDDLARSFLAQLARDADIARFLAVRQDPRRVAIYGLTHSLHTALACALVAQRMGMNEALRLSLVKAALTMNLSIIELQGRLAAHGNRPTGQQRETISSHPQSTAQALAAAGVTDADWLDAVAQHHELPDGRGYPQAASATHPLAAMLNKVDIFMTKISLRVNRKPLLACDAARELFASEGGSPFAAALVKEFGLHPPGDYVQLKSGERAVVLRRGDTVGTPLVAAVTNRTGMPIVDTVRRDTARSEFAIAGAVRDQRFMLRVPPERLYGLAT